MANQKEIIGGPLVVAGNTIPLSLGVRAGDFVFLSGQVPFKDGAPMTTGTIEEQTEVVMAAIEGILGQAGCVFSDVVKATIWLRDKEDFVGFNTTYAKYFPDGPPARSTVQSTLMVDARIEVEVVAYKPQ